MPGGFSLFIAASWREMMVSKAPPAGCSALNARQWIAMFDPDQKLCQHC
jgi:hypothetical protein